MSAWARAALRARRSGRLGTGTGVGETGAGAAWAVVVAGAAACALGVACGVAVPAGWHIVPECRGRPSVD
ncbi:hypothetical protein ACIRD6_32190 [Streptomyces sp. NPDC102473]|uniref:hypothetical protein n=1 Tax=Streptomyces sp. NPDC102473 TaxID=3366180 RepID=UPI0037F5FECC